MSCNCFIKTSCSISPRVFPEEKLNLDDSQWEDIHVVTGALKMFFRELPEPLFPYSFFERFVEAISKYLTDRIGWWNNLQYGIITK